MRPGNWPANVAILGFTAVAYAGGWSDEINRNAATFRLTVWRMRCARWRRALPRDIESHSSGSTETRNWDAWLRGGQK